MSDNPFDAHLDQYADRVRRAEAAATVAFGMISVALLTLRTVGNMIPQNQSALQDHYHIAEAALTDLERLLSELAGATLRDVFQE